MMRWMHKRLGVGSRDERGMALVMVIAIGSVLTILVVAATAFALGGLKKSTTDESWGSALAAAYAGIEEYQSRLANDTAYYRYGNPASSFSAASRVTLPTGASSNPAFGLGTAGTWAAVPGSAGASAFRYEVDNANYLKTGTLRLRATGKVGNETRSIVADLRQQGFVDFLYFTDYEIQDPIQSGVSVATCQRYAWAGRPATGCSEIAFGANDVVDGPAHSNDTMRICNATFTGKVTTSYNPSSGLRYSPKNSNNVNCSGQVFELPGYPAYSPVVGMPPTNSQMKKEIRTDIPAEVPDPGCLYTGPTQIIFNANGTMTVRSPWSVKTRVAGDPATSGTTPPECGSINALGSANGATITVPKDNLIYVQNVPTVATDPNFTPPKLLPNELACRGDGASSGAGNGIGFPTVQEVPPSSDSYGCRNGDAFVKGTVSGAVTVASENYVYVTGDLVYNDRAKDILGLVGNNSVWVWNPVRANGSSILANTGRRIDAAIVSVAHTFQLQNYNKGGDRGTLAVTGAIAQKFRGIVRSGTNGYVKHYVFDSRFRYIAPPKFISPVSTTYGVNVWIEVKPVFDSTGAAR